MAHRLTDGVQYSRINPDINIKAINAKYTSENSEEILCENYDYVVDAIDTVTAKLDLIERANKQNMIDVLSFLMQEKHKKFGTKRKTFEL